MELLNNTWWNGPSFLQHESEKWPDTPTNFEVEGANAELMKNPTTIIYSLVSASQQVAQPNNDLEEIIPPEHYSTRFKLLRVTALILKFVERLKIPSSQRSKEILTVESLSKAERMWTKTIQGQCFPQERKELAQESDDLPSLPLQRIIP